MCGPYQQSASQTSLESDWNEHLVNSILVVANEISADLMKDKRRVAGALKDQVLAGEQVKINPKCSKKFTIVNSTGWIICTNHDLAITLEQRDRRYSIIHSDRILLATPEGKALLDRIVADMQDPLWLAAVTDHIYSRPLDHFEARIPLENAARARAKEQSRTPVEAFWAELMSVEGGLRSGRHVLHALWTEYKLWCTRNGIDRPLDTQSFSRTIPSDLERTRWDDRSLRDPSTGRPHGRVQARGYVIPDYGQDALLLAPFAEPVPGLPPPPQPSEIARMFEKTAIGSPLAPERPAPARSKFLRRAANDDPHKVP